MEPLCQNERQTLEQVQRRDTKIPHLLRHLTNDERLQNLNITTLKVRQERVDLIQIYKIENGTNRVNWEDEYERGAPRRGMRSHIQKEIVSNCQQRSNFFKNRKTND